MSTFTAKVNASANDADESSGVLSSLTTRKDGILPIWFGWYFPNVTIPEDVTITSAILRIFADPSSPIFGGEYDPYARFYTSKNIIDPENFVDTPEISNRQVNGYMTSGSALFSRSLTFAQAVDFPGYWDVDITVPLQETINHSLWATGNALGVYAINLSNTRRFQDVLFYNYGAAYGAELTVDFFGDQEFTGTTGSIGLTGNAGSFDILPVPADILGTTGSIALTGTTPGLGGDILADSPKGYWPLNEASGTTASDYSGLAHHGTYVNSPSLNAPGLVRSSGSGAADFESSSSHHMTVPDHADLDPGDTFTLECVYKPEAFGANQTLFDKGVGGYNLTVTTTRFVQLQKRGTGVIVNSTIQLTAGETYHIVVTKSGSTVVMWINGVDRTGTISNQTIVATATALHIGRASGSSNYLDGVLQDVALYSTALSAARVAAHYAWLATEPSFVITTLVDYEGATGSIALVGQQGSFQTFAYDDDLTYGGNGVYGGDGLYDGPALDHPEPAGRIRVDIYDPQGNKLAVPPLTAITLSYSQNIDETGDFTLQAPAADPALDALGPVHPTHAIGYRLRIHVEGEGEVFRGIVREVSMQDSAEGDPLVVIRGPGVGDDFVSVNMLLGRGYIDQTPAVIATDIVGLVDGWSVGVISSPTSPASSSVSAEGQTALGALRQMCERFHYHVRLNTVAQTVDVGPMGQDSGLRITALPYYDPRHDEEYPKVIPLAAISVVEQGHDIWNEITPHGSGEGVAALTLEHSTRLEPYDILSRVAPDGRVLFYIEDEDSIATYGRRQRVVVDKHSVPLEVSEEALRAASDALYDGAVSFLNASKQPTHTYRISTAPFRHVVDGAEQFRLGDKVRVVFKGRATMEDGSGYLYLDIDEDLFLSGYSRDISDDGISWDLDVQDALGRRLDPAARMAAAIELIWATMVEPKLIDTDPPGQGEGETGVTTYKITIDARKIFWITRAFITFTVAGAGAWTGGTVSVNGEDLTTELGGPWTRGVEYTIDVKPYIDRLTLNEVVFNAGTTFTIEATKDTRGIGTQSSFLPLFD